MMKMDVIKPGDHPNGCCCPVCLGLTTYDQPLWGTGQVLTAADLTSLQTYFKAKNRLHNRYLHGWGVVCGLEVVCNDCDGYVTIRQGYAIDPCGNDIVVAEATPFDVIKAIRNCKDAKRTKLGPCDPYVPPPDPACKEVESYWCITLAYKEIETAYVRTLASAVPAPPASCGCGGKCQGNCQNKGMAGCGSQGASAATPAWTPTTSSTSVKPPANWSAIPTQGAQGCVPRRLLECFDVGVIETLDGCGSKLFKRGGEGGYFANLVPPDSLLGRIGQCWTRFNDVHTKQLSQGDQAVISDLINNTNSKAHAPADVFAAVCRYKQIVLSQLMGCNDSVRCQLLRAAGEISLAAPGNDAADTYWNKARPVAMEILALELQMLLDCVCRAFLPACSSDPCDQRVEIACVTVKGDKIIDICNYSCRRYAGAFPSLFYWISIVPIIPLIKELLTLFCCQPDFLTKNSPLVNNLVPLLDSVDPTGSLRGAVAANNFALPRFYVSELGKLQPSMLAQQLADWLAQNVTPGSLVGTPADTAKDALEKSGIKVSVRDLAAGADESSLTRTMLLHPVLRRGDAAVLYQRDGKVVAITPGTPPSVASADDIAALKTEIAALRSDLEALRNRNA
jgi:hypothetical protein